MTLTDNFMIGKRVEMIEHKSSGGIFDAKILAKDTNGFNPSPLFFVSHLTRHVTDQVRW